MKIFLSCDMEGATGLVSFDQVMPGNPRYDFGRAMQLHDVAAVVEAALEWGVEEVHINDAHHRMINLDRRGLPKSDKIRLISGSPKVLGMMEGVAECQGAFLVAYHAMAGTEKAVMDHTMGFSPFEVRLNGRAVGETGLNAGACGALDIPVAFVSGDDALSYEVASLLGPEVSCCVVKEGLGRHAGRLLSPEESRIVLQKGTYEALDKLKKGELAPLKLDLPCRGEITFCTTHQCDLASRVPGSERMSGRTLAFTSGDILEVYRWQAAAITIGEGA